MKKNILLGILCAAISFSTNAQVKVGTNPTQIVSGAKLQVDGDNTATTPSKLIVTGSGNVGIGNANPAANLDVTGAVVNRQVSVTIASNAATIPNGTSQVVLTGAGTAAITVTGPTTTTTGQRLVVYNNTTGNQIAVLNNFIIPPGQAVEFSYSNGNWRAQHVKYAQVFRVKLDAVNGITVNNGFTTIPFDATYVNPDFVYNTILGSTVNNAAGTITLPAGTYRVSGSVFITFNTAQVTGQSKYASLIMSLNGSSYNDFGWNVAGDNGANLSKYVNGSCLVKVPAGATRTVGLTVYTLGLNATNTAAVASGGIPINVFEVERID